jgi:hypothetical protein
MLRLRGGCSDPVLLGSAVAITGDAALISAPSDDIGTTPTLSQGSTHVFVRAGTSWTHQQMTVVDGAADDQFGSATAVFGDVIRGHGVRLSLPEAARMALPADVQIARKEGNHR